MKSRSIIDIINITTTIKNRLINISLFIYILENIITLPEIKRTTLANIKFKKSKKNGKLKEILIN